MIDSETLQMWQLVREPAMPTRPAVEVKPPRVGDTMKESPAPCGKQGAGLAH